VTFFVRTAGEGDIEAVRLLLVETWHATYDAIYGAERVTQLTDTWHSLDSLRRRLTRPSSEFLVADDGERIAGMAFAAADAEGKTVTLHQLYVLPAYQGHGIGGALLDEVLDDFPDAEIVRLEVEAANSRAIAFYKLYGFEQTGRTGNCGVAGSGIPALVFERAVGATA
jgi:ribosomal protein S18 acetylase RimI-like enzyme